MPSLCSLFIPSSGATGRRQRTLDNTSCKPYNRSGYRVCRTTAQNFANGTGPIHHSSRDQRVDNGALAVPSELYTGAEGRLIDPGLQRPKLYNLTSNETSCRPAVSSSTTNIERIDYCLQKPLDQRIEGGDGEGQPQIPTAFHNVTPIDSLFPRHDSFLPRTCGSLCGTVLERWQCWRITC